MQKKYTDIDESRTDNRVIKAKKLLLAFYALPKNSMLKSTLMALIISLFAGILVTTTSTLLKPKYLANKELDQQRYLLAMVRQQPGMEGFFETIEAEQLKAQVVDLDTGQYVQTLNPHEFDQRIAAQNPEQSIELSSAEDLANIKRREKYAKVYEVRKGSELTMIILPIYGKGFTSTLYGYLGLAADTNTVIALSFYEHGETPGLGARVGDPSWLQQWQGKKVRDPSGNIRIGVARGQVMVTSPEAEYQVDGLSGATWTSRSVTDLLHFWLGSVGYGPYLRQLRSLAE